MTSFHHNVINFLTFWLVLWFFNQILVSEELHFRMHLSGISSQQFHWVELMHSSTLVKGEGGRESGKEREGGRGGEEKEEERGSYNSLA